MTNTVQTRSALFGVSLLLLVCLVCCLAVGLGMRIYQMQWIIGVEKAARRVGVEPTLNGLAEYIKESIHPGMSREETQQVLSHLGKLQVLYGSLEDVGSGYGLIACDEIKLKLSPLPGHYWRIFACYDSNDKLVRMSSADPDDPLLGISAPVQPGAVVPIEPEKNTP
jgi:hypothetical protein